MQKPGSHVLYLGAASGTTVSHVSYIVGPTGIVYAVEFSHRSGRDLVNMAKKRTNIIPIIEDARHPQRYRMLVGMVDTIFADVAQPDQVRGLGGAGRGSADGMWRASDEIIRIPLHTPHV